MGTRFTCSNPCALTLDRWGEIAWYFTISREQFRIRSRVPQASPCAYLYLCLCLGQTAVSSLSNACACSVCKHACAFSVFFLSVWSLSRSTACAPTACAPTASSTACAPSLPLTPTRVCARSLNALPPLPSLSPYLSFSTLTLPPSLLPPSYSGFLSPQGQAAGSRTTRPCAGRSLLLAWRGLLLECFPLCRMPH